jgi:hypothetical protein
MASCKTKSRDRKTVAQLVDRHTTAEHHYARTGVKLVIDLIEESVESSMSV